MAKTLAQLQEAFNNKNSGGTNTNSDWKKFFQFWKIQEGQTAIVRFLPDLDDENPLGFLVENLTHELHINGQKRVVGCLAMHGEQCPICVASRKFYDEGDDKTGKKYYRKKSYIGQAIVVESPIEHNQDEIVKLVEFGPAIFKIMQAAFGSGDLDNAPYELKGGYNFRFKKTKKGEYADYSTSSFSPKMSDVGEDVIESINMYNLADYRTKTIDASTMQAMLDTDLTGAAFSDGDSAQTPAPKPAAAKAAKAEDDDADDAPAPKASKAAAETPATAEEGAAGSADYLKVIRERAAAKRKAQEEAGE